MLVTYIYTSGKVAEHRMKQFVQRWHNCVIARNPSQPPIFVKSSVPHHPLKLCSL